MTLGKCLAPEDIEVGQWIAPLNFDIEVPWIGEESISPKLEVLKARLQAAGCIPMKVKAICLPFLTVKSGKRVEVLDTRSVQFIRLDTTYAITTHKAFKRALKNARR